MKSYTNLEQSKKLAEILSLESADMCYSNDGTAIKIDANSYTVRYSMWKDYVAEIIPCWSLAALLKFFPKSAQLEKGNVTELYRVTLPVELEASDWYIDPLDACYEMIIKLHELNLL